MYRFPPPSSQKHEIADPVLFTSFRSCDQEIDLIHSRLKSISNLGLQRFGPDLKRLCLRQNHIKDLDPEVMKALTNLVELDLYDNKIKDLGESLDLLVNVT